jgi:hypothetical protein
MRFFIGENTIQAKAFGIYYDQGSGEYVVYKNKANGDRAVRYHGPDEAYAVNEIYQKMKSEISNQRTYQANKAMAAGGGPAHGGYNFNKKKSRSFWSILLTFVKFFGIGILALGIISIAYVLFVAPDNGYYTYGGTNYYLQGNDWYYYDTSVNDWQDYLLQMLQMGLFEIAYDEQQHTKVTPLGEDVLYGRKDVELSVVDRSVKEEAKKPKKRLHLEIPAISIPGLPPTTGAEDPKLFEALRQLRLQCAQEEGFPPYIVFSDKVLHSLAQLKPTTLEQFGFVSGVGEHKKLKYGERFVALIRRYV